MPFDARERYINIDKSGIHDGISPLGSPFNAYRAQQIAEIKNVIGPSNAAALENDAPTESHPVYIGPPNPDAACDNKRYPDQFVPIISNKWQPAEPDDFTRFRRTVTADKGQFEQAFQIVETALREGKIKLTPFGERVMTEKEALQARLDPAGQEPAAGQDHQVQVTDDTGEPKIIDVMELTGVIAEEITTGAAEKPKKYILGKTYTGWNGRAWVDDSYGRVPALHEDVDWALIVAPIDEQPDPPPLHGFMCCVV